MNILCCVSMEGIREVCGSFFTIEQCGSLFERASPCLKDEQVAVRGFEDEPAAVYDVVFPCDMFECDGVDVLVEDEGKGNDEVEDVETLGTDGERQDFDGVGNDEGRESNIVSGVVEEDERNDGMRSRFVSCDSEASRTNSLHREED